MISTSELEALDAAVTEALARGDDSRLRILGYGEISLVVGWPSDQPTVAAKRLPIFPGEAAYERYAAVFASHLEELRARGIVPVETTLHAVEDAGRITAYCVQPVLPPGSLLPDLLGDAGELEAREAIQRVVASTAGAIDGRLGLDAQSSNWAVLDGDLRYLDVTTPLMRGEGGEDLIDLDLFLAALPAALRPPVRRFVIPGVIDRYFRLRDVLVDLAANLLKERRDTWLPLTVDVINQYLSGTTAEPVTTGEVRKYYRSDARLWTFMLGIRRLDRAWQRHVRRRPYPFLLPGRIER